MARGNDMRLCGTDPFTLEMVGSEFRAERGHLALLLLAGAPEFAPDFGQKLIELRVAHAVNLPRMKRGDVLPGNRSGGDGLQQNASKRGSRC